MAADQMQSEHRDLKYLGFVEAAGTLAAVFIVRLYAVAKDWSGATRRSRIDDLERKVVDAAAPYHQMIKGNEHNILLFFDHKLDACMCTVRRHAPHVFKGLLDKTVDVARKVPDVLVDVSAEVHRAGVINTTKTYIVKAEPIAEEYLYLGWQQFLKLPFSPTIVHVAAPPTLFAGAKVNQIISILKARQVPFMNHVPLVPLDRIETVIKKEA